MGDMLSNGVSALLAFQQELDYDRQQHLQCARCTPGYSREIVNLVSNPGQYTGQVTIGSGVAVNSIQRVYNQTVASQVVTATSAYQQLNLFATQAARRSTICSAAPATACPPSYRLWSAPFKRSAIQGPTSAGARQALISQAQSLVSTLQSDQASLQGLNTQANASR